MLHEKFLGLPAIPEIRAIPGLSQARDYIQLLDWPALVKQARDRGHKNIATLLENGDEIVAQALDARSSAIESNMLLTTGLISRDDVSGACPNVPAYIMGNPYNMRNKRRDKTGRGPISLFIEMTGSSALDSNEMIERGAALYAMVKMISLSRPLDLWVTTTFGGKSMRDGVKILTQTAVRVETNPLDLARACTILTRYDDICLVGHRICNSVDEVDGYGWAYGVPELERKWAGEILGRIISPGSQIAYLPAGLLGEDDFSNPEEWIRKMLQEYSPYLLAGEDREDCEQTGE